MIGDQLATSVFLPEDDIDKPQDVIPQFQPGTRIINNPYQLHDAVICFKAILYVLPVILLIITSNYFLRDIMVIRNGRVCINIGDTLLNPLYAGIYIKVHEEEIGIL